MAGVVDSCALLSESMAYLTFADGRVISIDLSANQILFEMKSSTKLRFIYGNINSRLQRVLQGETAPAGICRNHRVFGNSSCVVGSAQFLLCGDRVMVVREIGDEERIAEFLEVEMMRNVNCRMMIWSMHYESVYGW